MFEAVVLAILLATSYGFVIEPKTNHDTRIVGGDNAVEGQFPWMISLRYRDENLHQCGGSIIGSKWILTAAHCFIANENSDDYIVVAGSIFLSSGGIAYNISRVIYHEDCNWDLIQNDVAIIELEEELVFTELVQPIELGTEFVDEVYTVLSGWGFLYSDGPAPDNLQYMNRRTVSNDECQLYDNFMPISDYEICTLSITDVVGFCNGDSGGPLVADGKQIGIVSWGWPCARGLPDVYMRVSVFAEWIYETIAA